MKIKEPVICHKHVTIIDGEKTVDTGLNAQEFVEKLLCTEGSDIFTYDKKEVAKAFVEACEKNLMLALIHNYDMWVGRYEAGYWDEETFNKRLGRRKDHPFAEIGGKGIWEQVKKIAE